MLRRQVPDDEGQDRRGEFIRQVLQDDRFGVMLQEWKHALLRCSENSSVTALVVGSQGHGESRALFCRQKRYSSR